MTPDPRRLSVSAALAARELNDYTPVTRQGAANVGLAAPLWACHAIAARIENERSQPPTEAADAAGLVAICESIVLAALPKRLDEDFLAEALRIEPAALRAAFLRVRGGTPYRMLLTLRLHTARQTMALRPDIPAAAVARQCGFPSYGRFSVEYETLFGERPPAPEKRRKQRPAGAQTNAGPRRKPLSPITAKPPEAGPAPAHSRRPDLAARALKERVLPC